MGFDLYGNSGNYFQANNWIWPPIVAILNESGQFSDNILTKLSANDAKRISKASAIKMARVLTNYLKSLPKEVKVIITADDELRVDKDRHFIEPGHPGWNEGQPAYSADIKFIKNFISFLEESSGFQVC
jgi:hypothetical protein